MRGLLNKVLFILAVALLYACGSQPLGSQSRPRPEGQVVTAAQIFEQMLADVHVAQAKRRWPEDFPRGHGNPYQLLDVKDEDWYGTEEAKFAHSIKIPNPVPADSGYRPGMTQQEYFEHLCKNEAGEFIFKTVDNVEGIYQLRPRKVYTVAEWQHLYAIEDPYGYWPGEAEDVGFQIVSPFLYSFFEIPVSGRRVYGLSERRFLDDSLHMRPPEGAVVARYAGYDGNNSRSMKVVYDHQAKARYAFTWRGITRPHDRELGIGGGELIVLDLQSNEVLGVRRGYVVWNRGWTGRMCPRYGYSGGQDKTTFFTAWFIAKVARPPRWQEFFAIEERYRRLPR